MSVFLTTKVVTAKETHLWVKNTDTDAKVTASVSGKKSLYEKGGLQAPLKKGQTVGTYNLKLKDQELYFLDGTNALKVPAQTKVAVDKANIFVIGWRALTGLFK